MMLGTGRSWMYMNCLVVALIHQTGSQNLPENDKITMGSYYYDKNSLVCAMVCRVEDTCTGLNHLKPAGCQCESAATLISDTNDDGTIKSPITPQTTATEDPIVYVVFVLERLYWYSKSGKLMYEVSLRPISNPLLEVDSAQTPKTLYCIGEYPSRLYSYDILSGKLLKAIPTRITGVWAFKVDSSTDFIIWTTGFDLKRCTLSGQNTSLLYNGAVMEAISIDRIHRHIYFGSLDSVMVVNYNGSGLRNVLAEQVEPLSLYYNEADETLYWWRAVFGEHGGMNRLISQKQHPQGRERIVVDYDELDCYYLIVHNQRIYFKEESERGISVVTLDGQKLPNLRTDIIPPDGGAKIIFL